MDNYKLISDEHSNFIMLENYSNANGKLINRAKQKADKIKHDLQAAKDKLDKTNKQIKDAIDKNNKKLADKLKKQAEKDKDRLKNVGKKVRKKIKDVAGKAKAGLKKILNKSILKVVSASIKNNIHGMASRLFPAIASPSELTGGKFKAAFVPKSKKSYDEILKEWEKHGGTKSKLDAAIRAGKNKRIFKRRGSKFTGSNFIASEMYANTTGEDIPVTDDEATVNDLMAQADSEPDDITSEQVTPEEQDDMDYQDVDMEPDTQEKTSGWKKFIAFICNVFKKNKADSGSPYDDGSAEDAAFSADDSTDVRTPEHQDSIIEEVDSDGDGIPDTKTIWGVNQYYVYGGAALLAIGLGVAGYFAYKKWGK